jgi:hypothetical protein
MAGEAGDEADEVAAIGEDLVVDGLAGAGEGGALDAEDG